MNAEIIAIGSELLTPHRTDTNSLYLTEQLNNLGVDVVLKSVVGDDPARLTEAIRDGWKRSDLVMTSGGLGPTEDDVTRDAASEALGRPLHLQQDLVSQIRARFRSRGMEMPEINARQAKVLQGAEILPNPTGTAPGQFIGEPGKMLILLPGPPRELRPMFEQSCLPRLRKLLPAVFLRRKVLRLTGITESAAEERIAPIFTSYTNPATTILATLGELQIHLMSHGREEAEAQARLEELSSRLVPALGDHVFSTNGDPMESVVARMLTDRNATLAVAESCTGGLLAERLTSVPGSSVFFLGGVVCYSNEWKQRWLDVPADTIERHGAVSELVARLLAEAVRSRAGSTYGVSITGIAGPGGATTAKPVGLVFIGLAGPKASRVIERRCIGERGTIRWQATQAALDLLRRSLEASRSG